MKKLLFICATLLSTSFATAEDGYRLWLRYDRITDAKKLNEYNLAIQGWLVQGESPTLTAVRNELRLGLAGMLANSLGTQSTFKKNILVCGTLAGSPILSRANLASRIEKLAPEGYLITKAVVDGQPIIAITSKSDIGVLYGVFVFLRQLQTRQSLLNISMESSPQLKLRLLNHWDNLDRTVERGYAGFSLWNWHKLPEYIDQRYIDYARANASVGINGAAVTNVNANALILTPDYLAKVAALANTFRPYGIKVFLTARFSAPIEIGGLKTADPLDASVREWWTKKASEIYAVIPDFGGFVVKANSEGQPGPQNYGRNHADGANMLAEALEEHGGVVIWRAFVYDSNNRDDRAKQAYTEFKPLDGTFNKNVMVQVKNGPIDFQPREPFHPMFGNMPKTPLMMEFQITQEYLGFSTHLVFLAPLFKESLVADTYAKGAGSTVAKVIDGSLDDHTLTGMTGVANIGNDINWCGHPFGQANWYAFGRLAWNQDLTSEEIATEWIRMTFTNDESVVRPIRQMMLGSREAAVNYMTPLGLHHIMGWDHHYGPGPWIKDKPRPEWTSVYYHQADTAGIGFDRTSKGSNALGQYLPEVQKQYMDAATCPEQYLLWFHHVAWKTQLRSGNNLWNSICLKYQQGVDAARGMELTWNGLSGKIDELRFRQVSQLLAIQAKEAAWWRDACLLYFQQFSGMPLPPGVEKPTQTLEYFEKQEFRFAPGIRPRW